MAHLFYTTFPVWHSVMIQSECPLSIKDGYKKQDEVPFQGGGDHGGITVSQIEPSDIHFI